MTLQEKSGSGPRGICVGSYQNRSERGGELKSSLFPIVDPMRKPAIGCVVAGTLVHTKDGHKPIEQIQVGDWVLSRPYNPELGTETGYKRVTKTFRGARGQVLHYDK